VKSGLNIPLHVLRVDACTCVGDRDHHTTIVVKMELMARTRGPSTVAIASIAFRDQIEENLLQLNFDLPSSAATAHFGQT
jgi:hypothetical protein